MSSDPKQNQLQEQSTPEIIEELKMRAWAEERLTKLGNLLEIAESRDIIAHCARTNYKESMEDLYKNKDALKSIEKSNDGLSQLTKALNEHKFKFLGFPKWTYMSFVIAKYGLFSMFYGMFASIFFGYILLYKTEFANTIVLSVPMWAAIIAGLGAAAQIMVGTVSDIKSSGVVQGYKRLWYTALPFLAAIFGFIAYILTDLGMLTASGNGNPSNYLNATSIGMINLTGLENPIFDNTTLNATGASTLYVQELKSFSVNAGNSMRMLLCFLVGFATNAFIDKMTKLSEKM